MKNKKTKYWFPRKTFGWGWGFPCSWQGWVVMVVYLIAMVTISFMIDPSKPVFYGVVFGLSAVLIGICVWKGEPPSGQWGNKKK